ncbi:MAG: cation:proton antiporter [Phycisphaerales bacterium JB063]
MPLFDVFLNPLAAGSDAAALQPSEITRLLLAIAALLGFARLFGELCRKYNQPPVLGEILAGIVLGATVFESISPAGYHWLFPPDGATFIATEGLVMLSAALLLFVVGLEVDLSAVIRQGKAMVSVSAFGIAIPLAIGFTIAYFAPNLLGPGETAANNPYAFAIFVGLALSITALPVIAKILLDLNLSRSDMGVLVISSAMCNDLVGWIGFAVVLALISTGESASGLGVPGTIVVTLLFLGGMLTLGRWVAHWVLPFVQARWAWPGGVISLVFVIAMVCGAFTEFLGIHSIFGAFIAGVVIGDSHHLRQRTRDTIHQFIMNIFAPLFFASIGLRVNFYDAFEWHTVLIVCTIALIGKVNGCYLGAKIAKMSHRESWAVGFGMAAQGAVGIILGQLAFQAHLISEELMVAIVIMALGTSLLAGPVMQRILQLKTKRHLNDMLTDRHILIDPEVSDIESLLRAMSARAKEVTGLDAESIYREVWARERVMHTALPHGLAVPHARLKDLNKPTVILARSHGGVDFDAADGMNARLIFLLLTPTDQPETQLELLSLVAKTFDNEIVRARCLAATNATELRAVLNQAAAEETASQHHDDETLGM